MFKNFDYNSFTEDCEADEKDAVRFVFDHRDRYCNVSNERVQSFDAFVTWDEVLASFISFLSGVYGYDIGRYVQIEHPAGSDFLG